MFVRRFMTLLLVAGVAMRADEGMWTFDNPPLAQMKARYGFEPDAKWLEHLRLSALEFGFASGSFVSKDGLVITNHHVGRKFVEKVSETGEKDYLKHGFVAKTRADEIKIPDMRLYTLMKMVPVTDKVNEAVKPGMDEAQATKARQERLEKLRNDLDQRDGLSVWEVKLYQGGEYWLYGYKVHKDVRLVMAPEMQIAYFGGDPDNFTYPRFDLDITLFRVYEGGQPYQPKHHLAWATEGLKEGDLTFVVGAPGRTSRWQTLAQMKHQRDTEFPEDIRFQEGYIAALREYSKGSPDLERRVSTRIFLAENSLKAIRGEQGGLLDAKAMAELERKEQEIRAGVAKDPRLQAEAGQSWARIEEALAAVKPLAQVEALVNARNSKLLQMTLRAVRCAQEASKPSAERLNAFRKADDLDLEKWRIQRAEPFEDLELETFLIAKGLEDIQAQLPEDHPFRKAVMDGQKPSELAKAVVAGTKMHYAYARRDLVAQGAKGVQKSKDPLVILARNLEGFARDIAWKMEQQRAIMDDHTGRIARARFVLFGKSQYPDATGTLRFAFGKVAGYQEQGTTIQPFTTFQGLYERAAQKGPDAANGAWALPERWKERKGRLDLGVPLNLCHTVDIIGGNSGSPVINAKGEFAGIVFDGNLQSLPGAFYFDESVNRAVSVDGRAILESLVKVYDAKHLVDELLGK